MTTASLSRHHRGSSANTSSHTTELPTLTKQNSDDSDTILVATKLSSVSLVEREGRQKALDRLEILKTVRRLEKNSF